MGQRGLGAVPARDSSHQVKGSLSEFRAGTPRVPERPEVTTRGPPVARNPRAGTSRVPECPKVTTRGPSVARNPRAGTPRVPERPEVTTGPRADAPFRLQLGVIWRRKSASSRIHSKKSDFCRWGRALASRFPGPSPVNRCEQVGWRGHTRWLSSGIGLLWTEKDSPPSAKLGFFGVNLVSFAFFAATPARTGPSPVAGLTMPPPLLLRAGKRLMHRRKNRVPARLCPWSTAWRWRELAPLHRLAAHGRSFLSPLPACCQEITSMRGPTAHSRKFLPP